VVVAVLLQAMRVMVVQLIAASAAVVVVVDPVVHPAAAVVMVDPGHLTAAVVAAVAVLGGMQRQLIPVIRALVQIRLASPALRSHPARLIQSPSVLLAVKL
jgi:hypothetical protein